MPSPDPQEFSKHIGRALLLEAIGQIPVLGVLTKAAWQAYQATRPAELLTERAKNELRRMAMEYAQFLETETKSKEAEEFSRLYSATLDVINRWGLSLPQLASEAHLEPEAAARLTFERAAADLDILDHSQQQQVRRLVQEYYRLLIDNKDALESLGIPALKGLLDGMVQLSERLESLLNRDQRRAWDRTKWPQPIYDDSGGLYPSALHPRNRLILYQGAAFTAMRDELRDWALNLGERDRPLGLRLYVGPGGAGKTRLIFEAGDALQQLGWRTAMLLPLPGALEPGQAVALLNTPEPVLLVMDYVLNRGEEVKILLEAMASSRRDQPFALVLLERQPPVWWEPITHPASDPTFSGIVNWLERYPPSDLRPHPLPQLSAEERLALYREARAVLGRLTASEPPGPQQPGTLPDRPMFVLLLAYLHASGEQVLKTGDEKSILSSFWRHEQKHWQEVFSHGELRNTRDESLMNKLMALTEDMLALASLGLKFPDESHLADFLERNAAILRRPIERNDQPLGAVYLAEKLSSLYPAGEGNVLPPPPLDVLVDDLLERRLAQNPRLLTLALPTPDKAAEEPDGSVAEINRTLDILVRIWLSPRHQKREQVQDWIDALAEALPADLPRPFWEAMERRLEASVPLRVVSLKAYQKELDLTPAEDSAERARLLNNLGSILSELGRRAEALQAAQEATDIYRQLAAANPQAFQPDMAMSLNNLGNRLSELGRREEALQAAQEAVSIRRQLAAANPQAFQPKLAMSLNNLGSILSELGRREEALQAAQEATDIYRQLAAANPQAFQPKLAMSLGTHGLILSAMHLPAEAARAFGEGLRAITPSLRALPQAFASLAGALLSDYLKACEQAGQPPDMALITPVREILKEIGGE